MIDRNQRDALILKINDIKNVFVQLNKPQYMFDFSVCQMKMEELINNSQEQFSPEKAGEYTEVLQGIQLALLQINNQHIDNHAEIDEMVTLCIELTDYLIKKLRAEKDVKKEVYFLPYKLDMWDSLESIWQVLNEDEHFNAYVMPIPWAERNVDTSAKEWHFELQEFSKCVPVVDYRNVDLAAVRPDVIFIHNPYDGENIATSVDMHFYSDKLKKCTDTLIYVPYFVVGDKIKPDKCKAPAIHYADYVIVQDENIKKQYEENYLWGDPKGKFLPFGSPKFDKVLSTSRQDYTLPVEWQQKIKGKKVILYNTSINDMMRYDEYYIAKLKSVFAYFKDRDDVVLWWRPHPLLKASINTVRPELYTEFCDLEKQYKEQSFGVYDDTSDMNRAIAYSDAYYGDRSSLVWLYKMTGKPVMLQDYKKIDFGLNMQLKSYFLTTDGKGNSWGIQSINNYQFLFHINNKNGKTKILAELPNSFSRGWAYGALAYCQEKIIILPWHNKVPVLIYDIKMREFTMLQDLLPDLKKTGGGFFSEKVLENRHAIYFMSSCLEIVLQYSKGSKQFTVIPLNIEKHNLEWCTIKDNKIMIACGTEWGIIDVNTWKVHWKKMPKGKIIWRMEIVDNCVWIQCAYNGEIACYEIKRNKYFFKSTKKQVEAERPFWGVVKNGDSIIFLPGQTDMIGICTKRQQDIIIEYKKIEKEIENKSIVDEYITAVAQKNGEWLALTADGKYIMQRERDNIKIIKLQFNDDELYDLYRYIGYRELYKHSCIKDNLIFLMDCLAENHFDIKIEKRKKCSGNIHDFILSVICNEK